MPTTYRKLLLGFIVFLIATSNLYCQKENQKLIVFHLDFNSVSLRKDYLMKWINKASEMGYNSILWEIEDEVKWETCPECVSEDAFTKNEFKEIIEYSRSLGLEPIPLLQTIGHGEYVLQNKKYYSFREDSSRYDCYCTSNGDVKLFMKKWIDEYLEVFGDVKYFHLGGDEAYAFATCNKCKAVADQYGKNKLYADYLNEIAEPLFKKGIRPGIWSDMILSHPVEMEAISNKYLIWDWNYWDGDSIPNQVMVWGKGRLSKENITQEIHRNFPQIIQANNLNPFYTSDYLKEKGYDVILCSSSRCYGDAVFVGRNNLHIDNIVGAARKVMKLDLLGTCVTSWAVRVPNYETQEVWLNLAPLTIKNPTITKDKLVDQTLYELFGVNDNSLNSAFEKISYSFQFANNNTTGIMWTGLKDSKPAPQNYINELIEKWKQRKQWEEIVKTISQSAKSISIGINELNQLTTKTNGGYDILNEWSKAGYFQYWQSFLANQIVRKEKCESKFNNVELANLSVKLKKEYTSWAREWMTSRSAEENAGLIYDSLINYFNNKVIN